MNTTSDTCTIATTRLALSQRERRKRDIRRARTFFLISLMTALVSYAGHCLPDAQSVTP